MDTVVQETQPNAAFDIKGLSQEMIAVAESQLQNGETFDSVINNMMGMVLMSVSTNRLFCLSEEQYRQYYENMLAFFIENQQLSEEEFLSVVTRSDVLPTDKEAKKEAYLTKSYGEYKNNTDALVTMLKNRQNK